MGMSKCYSLMKCLLIIFNIIFLMVGSGACAFGAWALYTGHGGVGEGSAGRAGLCALVAWGCALCVGAAAALAGAARGSASLLAAAFALLALTAVAEGAAAWWGAKHVPALKAALRDELARTLRHDYGVAPSRTSALDSIQQGLQCCGESGARDWQQSAWARAQAGPAAGAATPLDLSVGAPPNYYWVPASCCKTRDAAQCEAARRVPAAGGGGAALHAGGCGERVVRALWGAARAPLAAAAALLAAHAAALLLTLALCLRDHPSTPYKA